MPDEAEIMKNLSLVTLIRFLAEHWPLVILSMRNNNYLNTI